MRGVDGSAEVPRLKRRMVVVMGRRSRSWAECGAPSWSGGHHRTEEDDRRRSLGCTMGRANCWAARTTGCINRSNTDAATGFFISAIPATESFET
jgi:hypothetical protein